MHIIPWQWNQRILISFLLLIPLLVLIPKKVMLPLEEFFLPPPLPYLCHDLKKKKTTKVSLDKRNYNYPRSTHLSIPSPPCLPFMS